MKLNRLIVFAMLIIFASCFVACGNGGLKAIELMGAGDRMHDSYTFANIGTKIKDDGKNTYTIYGSVEKLIDENVKTEFKIAQDIMHIVAIKLSAIDEKVVKDEVEIYINGARNYDAEHLNGSSFTYILLEAKVGSTVSISVKWNNDADVINYILYFDQNLQLK